MGLMIYMARRGNLVNCLCCDVCGEIVTYGMAVVANRKSDFEMKPGDFSESYIACKGECDKKMQAKYGKNGWSDLRHVFVEFADTSKVDLREVAAELDYLKSQAGE